MKSPRPSAFASKDCRKVGDLGANMFDQAPLYPVQPLGIAVHRVTQPDRSSARLADGLNQSGEATSDLSRAMTDNQCQPPGLALRIEPVAKREQFARPQRWPAFHPDRIGDPAEEFDMGTINLPSAVADPQEMSRPAPPASVYAAANQRLLVGQEQRFMACEQRIGEPSRARQRMGVGAKHPCRVGFERIASVDDFAAPDPTLDRPGLGELPGNPGEPNHRSPGRSLHR